MWTAKLFDKSEYNGIFTFQVQFSNGSKSVVESISVADASAFDGWVEERLKAFTDNQSLDAKFSKGGAIVKPVVAVPVDSPEEAARKDWLVKAARLQQAKAMFIDTGIIDWSDSGIVALVAELKKGYKPEYLSAMQVN